ncbi:hypothetical protein LOAG_13768 [Loa loa]|uniref:Uncharacterized protein n=1 Tax=Loa loa TaxID=7209 RepID=A0A1S0TJF4_LOALO|nr:hypothetical protein LOAG_13768 [Loa loa]EFO14748.1 hypothetical protein LOAG_13768 [Loa loa]
MWQLFIVQQLNIRPPKMLLLFLLAGFQKYDEDFWLRNDGDLRIHTTYTHTHTHTNTYTHRHRHTYRQARICTSTDAYIYKQMGK